MYTSIEKMPLVPYKPDVEAWIAHFKDSKSRDPNAKWHPVVPLRKKKDLPPPPVQVNLVTPVQQAVVQAKAKLKAEKKKKKNPWDRR